MGDGSNYFDPLKQLASIKRALRKRTDKKAVINHAFPNLQRNGDITSA